MDQHAAHPDAVSTGPTDRERLRRFVLRPVRKFGLAVVQCSTDRLRNEVREEMLDVAAAQGVRVATFDAATEGEGPLWERMRAAATAEGGALVDVLFVVGLNRRLVDAAGRPAPDPEVLQWNLARDLMPEVLPLPVVLWLSDVGARAFTLHVRDLNDIILTRFHFDEPTTTSAARETLAPDMAAVLEPEQDLSLDARERLLREVRLLESLFERERDKPERAGDAAARLGRILFELGELERAETWLRRAIELQEQAGARRAVAARWRDLGNLHQRRGDLHDAQSCYEMALRILDELGDQGGRAAMLIYLTDTLIIRGDLDEALRTLRDEVLPIYKALGDVRGRAVALGKVADILARRGELEEALRIRQEEELPVYELLGDVRERAIALRKVADILLMQGGLDAALRILQEELLPTFEALGDVRLRALTLGGVGVALALRGELEEALRILREEELPVYERLGEVRELALGRTRLAMLLHKRGDQAEACRLVRQALLDAERLGLGETERIRKSCRTICGNDAASGASGAS